MMQKNVVHAEEVCPTTSFNKLKDGALLVDIRERRETKEVSFDIENKLEIPLSELEERLDEIPKDQEIIMACLSGPRSLKATYFLLNNGYKKVYNMDGGITKWASKAFPTKGKIASSACDCSVEGCC